MSRRLYYNHRLLKRIPSRSVATWISTKNCAQPSVTLSATPTRYYSLLSKCTDNEWSDMCGAEYTPYELTNNPKIYGVVAARYENNTVGKVGWRWGTSGYT